MTKSTKVAQHNALTQHNIYQTLNEIDIRILKSIFSCIDSNDTLFEEFYIVDYDTLDLAGVPKRDRYKKVSDSLKKLAGVFLKIPLVEDDEIMETGLIKNKFIYKPKSGKFIVSIDEDLKPVLLELKRKFSSYYLQEIAKLKGDTEIILFELLNSFKKNNTYTISKERLVDLLNLSDSYSRWADLNRLLKKMVLNISQNTNLFVEFKPIKQGRKVEKILFIIKDKKIVDQLNFDKFINKNILVKDNMVMVFKSAKLKDDKTTYLITALNMANLETVSFSNETFKSKDVVLQFLEKAQKDYENIIK